MSTTSTPAIAAAYRANRAANPRLSATYALHLARTGRSPSTPSLGHGDVVRWCDPLGRKRAAVIAIVPDDEPRLPWEEEDGHGPVTDWTTCEKRPGELVLAEDGHQFRYYDFAEAVKIALRDRWGHGADIPGETPGQKAARAARADFDRLRAYCDGGWSYVGVCLFELPRDGMERSPHRIADRAPFGILPHAAIWGVESDCEEHIGDLALELTADL